MTKLNKIFGALCVSAVLYSLLRAVDLRFLQRIGIIHVHRLPFCVKVNRADAALAMAVARCLRAAEWEENFRADRWSIDVGDAGLKIAHRPKCLVHVFGVERRR